MTATRRPYTCSHSNNFSLRLLSYYWSTFNFYDWMILKSSGDLTSFLLAEEERNDFLSRLLLWINGLLVCLFKTKKLCSLQLHKVIIIHLWIFKAGPSWYSVLKFQMTPFILISLWKPIASSVENDKVKKAQVYHMQLCYLLYQQQAITLFITVTTVGLMSVTNTFAFTAKDKRDAFNK